MERGKKNSDRRRRAERGSERSGQEDGTTYTSRGDRSTTVSLHTMDGRLTSRFLGFAIFPPKRVSSLLLLSPILVSAPSLSLVFFLVEIANASWIDTLLVYVRFGH